MTEAVAPAPATQPPAMPTPAAPAVVPPPTPPTGDPPPANVAPADGAKPEAKEEKLTPRFLALARQEKKLAEERAALKEAAEKAKAFEAARGKVKDDPFAALEVLGLSLDDLVAAAVKKDKPETIEDKVSRLEAERKAEREAAEKAKADAETKAMQAQVEAVRASVRDFVTQNAEKYEITSAQKAHDHVFEVMSEHFEQTGELMPVEKAADMVEDFLYTRAVELAKASKKLAGVFSPKPAEPPPAAEPPAKPSWFTARVPARPAAAPAPTLTNAMGATPPAPHAPPPTSSREEAVSRIAAKYFRKT